MVSFCEKMYIQELVILGLLLQNSSFVGWVDKKRSSLFILWQIRHLLFFINAFKSYFLFYVCPFILTAQFMHLMLQLKKYKVDIACQNTFLRLVFYIQFSTYYMHFITCQYFLLLKWMWTLFNTNIFLHRVLNFLYVNAF